MAASVISRAMDLGTVKSPAWFSDWRCKEAEHLINRKHEIRRHLTDHSFIFGQGYHVKEDVERIG